MMSRKRTNAKVSASLKLSKAVSQSINSNNICRISFDLEEEYGCSHVNTIGKWHNEVPNTKSVAIGVKDCRVGNPSIHTVDQASVC